MCKENEPRVFILVRMFEPFWNKTIRKKCSHILGIKKNKWKDIANGKNDTKPEELFLCLTMIGSRTNFTL